MEWILFLILAVSLDLIIGDPPGWPHPIRLIGFVISKYEKLIRRVKWIPLKFGGFLLTFCSIVIVTGFITLLLYISNSIHPIIFKVIATYLLFTTVAAKCLHIEAKKIYKILKGKNLYEEKDKVEKHRGKHYRGEKHKEKNYKEENSKEGNLKEARKALSYLVGRDTSGLERDGIIRAVVETVAENTIDGVIAPIFYITIGIFLGIPVQMAFIYKTINTLDSMVGYTQEPYKDIGFASARLDDLVNYIPARIGSLLMLLAGIILGYDGNFGYTILKRDRKNHKSPNCAYPESVVAGLLKIQLGGSNTYFGQQVYKPTIGDQIHSIKAKNIRDTIKIMYGAEILYILIFLIILISFGIRPPL